VALLINSIAQSATGPTQHEVPGATRRFKDFVDAYASGTGSASRDEMYALRSGILHGSKLIEIDYALAFGWDPPWWNQRELLWDLSTITRIALRNWLKGQPSGVRQIETNPPGEGLPNQHACRST
jgi:hypothetical protein